ncbi:MAG: DUF1428 family protein [Alphaproteobacteria bacterium]|nr:DUF1428 family protein [Alphaproteobacteria bacterium]MDE2042201.1 DUF1428 domain-containing protein [Alphaproteobacteria bacterium]MDE2341564.1 DUF1428 domain-containing protein [Alphaproteobacteria bacterium]
MSYIDGMIVAVPRASKSDYIEFAHKMNALFLEYGATRLVDAWGEDVPHGKQTDFHRAVAATEDETVVFSWIEWPDKATRDAAWGKIMEDPRMKSAEKPPYEGSRLIYGGFEALIDIRGDAK